jgi:hypothetical protein
MKGPADWLDAFPLPQANTATAALVEAWNELASIYRPHFNHATAEPKLTLVLKCYLRDVVAPRRRLLGAWGAEDVGGRIDYATGEIIKRFRTDIRYTWNNAIANLDLVFEFKKLDSTSASRGHYYGVDGMGRFVAGTYSAKEPVALMVGLLLKAPNDCVVPLRTALEKVAVSASLRMTKAANGAWLRDPSEIFPSVASFDTEHERLPDPSIRLSHLFLSFGYAKT